MSVARTRRRLSLAGVVVVAAVATWTIVVPGAGAAPLPVGGVPQSFTLTTPTRTHTAQGATVRWAVAAVDDVVSVQVRDAGGVLGQSGPAGLHAAAWVAIDQNPGRRPPGPYLLDVRSAFNGTGTPYRAQFLDGAASLASGSTTEVGRADGSWLVDLRQIRLTAGDTLRLTVRGSAVSAVNVLRSDPARPSTWVANSTTVDQTFWLDKPESTDVATFTYQAPVSATYALIFERGWWDATAVVTAAVQ